MMKSTARKWWRPVLIVVSALVVTGGLMMSLSGQKPKNLGIAENRLQLCPDSPNCVCSYEPAERSEQTILPLEVPENLENPLAKLVEIIETLPRTKLISTTEEYLHVEFTSLLLRFVDDVEFQWVRDQNLIHVRSASRVGHSDLGANRKRVEQVRQLWE